MELGRRMGKFDSPVSSGAALWIGFVLVIAATAIACGDRAHDDAKGRGSPTTTSTTSVTSASASARSTAAAPPSASVAATAAPVSSASPVSTAPPPRALGGAVAFLGKVKGDGPALFVADLATMPLSPKKIAADGDDFTVSEPALDPTGKTVVWVRNHHENASAPPDEVWAAALATGDAHRVAKCTATCRSPHVLEDGRIVYVDHGIGLGHAVVRVSGAGKTTTLYGGDAAISACFVGIDVDPAGKLVVVFVDNALGWPDCTIDKSFAGTTPKLTLAPLPASVPGRAEPRASALGRIFFVGGDEAAPRPSSIAADGTGLLAPDPSFDGQHVPEPGWAIEAVDAALVARPPKEERGATGAGFTLFTADELTSVTATLVR
jgi:hypothetical protein